MTETHKPKAEPHKPKAEVQKPRPEARSPLQGLMSPTRPGLSVDPAGTGVPGICINEISGRDIVQISTWPQTTDLVLEKLNQALGVKGSMSNHRTSPLAGRSLFAIAPDKMLLTAPRRDQPFDRLQQLLGSHEAVITDLSHALAILTLSGTAARQVLARAMAIDLAPSVFPPGCYCRASIHHITLLVHHRQPARATSDAGGEDDTAAPSFDIHIPRSFAVAIWQWLLIAAEPFGLTVAARQDAGAA